MGGKDLISRFLFPNEKRFYLWNIAWICSFIKDNPSEMIILALPYVLIYTMMYWWLESNVLNHVKFKARDLFRFVE